MASHVLFPLDWTYRQPSDSGTQATNLFNLSDFIPFHLSSRNDHLTYISFIPWTSCSKGDTRHATCRHAAHCELDALFDHGSHDMTTCATLPSTSFTQHPIGDLTDGLFTTFQTSFEGSISRQLLKGSDAYPHGKQHQRPHASRLSSRHLDAAEEHKTAARRSNNSSRHLSSILLGYRHQSSPGSLSTFYIYSSHSFSGCTLKTRTLSI